MPHRCAPAVCTGIVIAVLAVTIDHAWREHHARRDMAPRRCPYLAWRDAPCAYVAPCDQVRPIPVAWTHRAPPCLYVHVPGHHDRAMLQIDAAIAGRYRRPLW